MSSHAGSRLRGFHPESINRAGVVSYRALLPTKTDEGKLSVDDGGLSTPTETFRRRISLTRYNKAGDIVPVQCAGVLVVPDVAFTSRHITIKADPEPYPAHSLADYHAPFDCAPTKDELAILATTVLEDSSPIFATDLLSHS